MRVDALWRHFNSEYFIRHDAATIARHTAHILAAELQQSPSLPSDQAVLVASQHYVLNDVDNSVQLMVYTADKPDLFARICAVIQQRGFRF